MLGLPSASLGFPAGAKDVVVVTVGGSSFAGWTQAEVERHLNAASGSFSVSLVGRGMEKSAAIGPFLQVAEPDTECTITCNGQLVLTGRIDTVVDTGSEDSHRVTVSGRSLGRNAVDSSHIDPKGSVQYNKRKPTQISKTVLDALGLPVKITVSGERPIQWFRYHLGESALNVILAACLKQGINVGHRPDGSIWLSDTFEEAAPSAIVLGQNVLRWTVRKSVSQRNSEYNGQGQKLPNSKTRGKKSNQQRAKVTDPGVKSKRPRVIVANGDTDSQEIKERLKAEASRRSGLALNVTVTVQGWTTNGGIWMPGQLAYVDISTAGISQQLLIKTVKQVQDYGSTGSITEMTLVRPEAFQKGKAQGSGGSGGSGGKPQKGAPNKGLDFPFT